MALRNAAPVRRLTVCQFADFENVMDRYFRRILRELSSVSDRLALVCNSDFGTEEPRGLEEVRPLLDGVFFRPNRGYDGGAFRDALCDFIGWDEVGSYDELLLVNDTFFGFFSPMPDILREAERLDCDYWGMTRAPGTEIEGRAAASYIQSYFLAFRRNVLRDGGFRVFWEAMEQPRDAADNIWKFEIALNRTLEGMGCRGGSYMDLYPSAANSESKNPYLTRPLELVRDNRLPILKKKALEFFNGGMAGAWEAAALMEAQGRYDTALIREHLDRIHSLDRLEGRMHPGRLAEFCRNHKRLYIYGAGVYGRNLAAWLEKQGYAPAGFLVTERDGSRKDAVPLREAELGPEDGVIIAIWRKSDFLAMYREARKRWEESRIFHPFFRAGQGI